MTLPEFARNAVRHKRRALDLTQGQLAEKAQVGIAYYNRFERGRIPDIKLSVLHRICQVLEMPLNIHVHGKEEQYLLSPLPQAGHENRE